MSTEDGRTALYRIRGEGGELIYIGITAPGIPFRWNGHQAVQPWWDEVRTLTIEWYKTRAKAEAAEKAAIRAEQPKCNVTYLKPSRGRGRQGSSTYRWHVRRAGKGGHRKYGDDDFDLYALVALDIRQVAYVPPSHVQTIFDIWPAGSSDSRQFSDYPFGRALTVTGVPE